MSDVVPDVGRHAVLVDAGYLYASVGQLVLGRTSRREFRVAAEPLIGALLARADRTTPGGLLRMYWYDAARDRVPTVEQRQIAALPNVKVRLGNLNSAGQQKGVDAQLRQDLEVLARHRAVSDVVLIAGDEDMVSAVEAAQAYGVRVHVWGVEPPYGVNQAERLVWEADTVDQLDAEFCRPYVEVEAVPAEEVAGHEPREEKPAVPTPADVFAARKLAAPPPKPVAAASVAPAPPDRPGPERPEMEQIGARIAARWLLTRGRENVADLLPGPVLPTVIDKELLVEAEEEISRSLRPYEEARRALRDGFWAKLHQEFGIQPAAVPPHPTADHQSAVSSHQPTPPGGSPAHSGPAASAHSAHLGSAAHSGPASAGHSGAPAAGRLRPAAHAHPGPGPSGAPAPGQPGPAHTRPAGYAAGGGPAAPGATTQPNSAPRQDHAVPTSAQPDSAAHGDSGRDHPRPGGPPPVSPAVQADSSQDHSRPGGPSPVSPAVQADSSQDHSRPAGPPPVSPAVQADSSQDHSRAPGPPRMDSAASAAGPDQARPAGAPHPDPAARSAQDHSRPGGPPHPGATAPGAAPSSSDGAGTPAGPGRAAQDGSAHAAAQATPALSRQPQSDSVVEAQSGA